jgi:hypothetical protein
MSDENKKNINKMASDPKLLNDVVEEKSYVTEEDAKNDKNGIYFDPNSTAEEIVDLEKMTSELVGFLAYINTPQMEELEESDHDAYVAHLESKFEEFSLHFYSIFKLLTEKGGKSKRDENVGRLIGLIEVLKQVQDGNRDMNQSYETFKEGLNEEFIYSKYGGKKQFEEHMRKENSKKSKSKKNKRK